MVALRIPDDAPGHNLTVEFFPEFEGETLVALPGRVSHSRYSVFDPAVQSSAIVDTVIAYFDTVLSGNSRLSQFPEANVMTFIRIDGNRRLVLRPTTTQYVDFEFVDLSVAPDSVISGVDLRNYRPRDRYVIE